MKKILQKTWSQTLLLACLFSLSTLSAQDVRIYVGASAFGGATMILNQNNYGLPEMSYRPSFDLAGGGVLGLAFDNKHQFQIELNYAAMKQRYADHYEPGICGAPFDLKKTTNIQYVQVPLLYRYVFTPRNRLRYRNDRPTWYINGGIQFSKLAGGSVDYELNRERASWTQVQQAFCYIDQTKLPAPPRDTDQPFQKYSIDGVIGFGWQTFLSRQVMLGIEGRSFISLTDINSPYSSSNGISWRVPNPSKNVYAASRNFAMGLRVNLCCYID